MLLFVSEEPFQRRSFDHTPLILCLQPLFIFVLQSRGRNPGSGGNVRQMPHNMMISDTNLLCFTISLCKLID